MTPPETSPEPQPEPSPELAFKRAWQARDAAAVCGPHGLGDDMDFAEAGERGDFFPHEEEDD